jgi:hypothetical protein
MSRTRKTVDLLAFGQDGSTRPERAPRNTFVCGLSPSFSFRVGIVFFGKVHFERLETRKATQFRALLTGFRFLSTQIGY